MIFFLFFFNRNVWINFFIFRSHIIDTFKNGQIESVDFTDSEMLRVEINEFVREFTRNYIKELLPVGSIFSDMNAVLTNAAFFKGSWQMKFDQQLTQTKAFNGLNNGNVEMMHIKEKFYHGLLRCK